MGEEALDLDPEGLMILWEVATRIAGSGAVGKGFIGDRGGVAEYEGLADPTSTLYLSLVDLAGT